MKVAPQHFHVLVPAYADAVLRVFPSACQRDRNARRNIQSHVRKQVAISIWKAAESQLEKVQELSGAELAIILHRLVRLPKAEGWRSKRELTSAIEKHKKLSIPVEGEDSLFSQLQ